MYLQAQRFQLPGCLAVAMGMVVLVERAEKSAIAMATMRVVAMAMREAARDAIAVASRAVVATVAAVPPPGHSMRAPRSASAGRRAQT